MPVTDCAAERPHASASKRAGTRIALLGLGQVGSAVARLAAAAAPETPPVQISGALVRRVREEHTRLPFPVMADPAPLLESRPDVVVEVLGGAEPARTIVLEALRRRIPVVTANKSLLAVHGPELASAAEESGTSLRYEAAVIAGVPFLGTLARRPRARRVTRLAAILNGTSNFVLSELAERAASMDDALHAAQAAGFAEPDPHKDLSGADAAEKLCVLLRHIAGLSVPPASVPIQGITGIVRADLEHAAEFAGTLKAVAAAEWSGDDVGAFVAPAFVPLTDPLSTVRGVLNGIRLHGSDGLPIFFAGPGAGPDVTAATILDDVCEIAEGDHGRPPSIPTRRARIGHQPAACWFIRLESRRALPHAIDTADLLASYGVWIRRESEPDSRNGAVRVWLLTHPCSESRVRAACEAFSAAGRAIAIPWRSLEVRHG